MIKTTKKRKPPSPRNRYPFATMKIGKSFDVPIADKYRARSAASQYQRRHDGVLFSGRTDGEVFRIWRIE